MDNKEKPAQIDPNILLDELSKWEQREFMAEQQATIARTQQARIIGRLASQGIHLFPPIKPEE